MSVESKIDLTLDALYAVAKDKGLLAEGWQSSGEYAWNALHIVILQAASAQTEIAILNKLLSVAKHPKCHCSEESVCEPRCCHYSPIISRSCQWCADKWQAERDRLYKV